jgi:uncharacterized protein
MQADPNDDNLTKLREWVSLLVCPACHEALRADANGVVCTGCGRVYPVVDGIPVLIVERAEKRACSE